MGKPCVLPSLNKAKAPVSAVQVRVNVFDVSKQRILENRLCCAIVHTMHDWSTARRAILYVNTRPDSVPMHTRAVIAATLRVKAHTHVCRGGDGDGDGDGDRDYDCMDMVIWE